MSIILYITGFLIGLALFLYLVSLYQTGRVKISGMKNGKGKSGDDGGENQMRIQSSGETGDTVIKSDGIRFRNLTDIPPGKRMCPLCRASLTRFEPLYASHIETDSGKKILIYGCAYCYKGTGNSH